MNGKKVLIALILLIAIVSGFFVLSSKGVFNMYEDFVEKNPEYDRPEVVNKYLKKIIRENGYYFEDNACVAEYRNEIDSLYGKSWKSRNYDKNEIIIPKVESEETVTGENWFPPINNTAPIDSIAPTISFELACDGCMISPYYPQNPEKYTAQALNKNAFPIAFFRKVNDLCYYTVCKVEGGGYMYYFFCANGNADYEESVLNAGKEIAYDKHGNIIKTETDHLFNAGLADISGMDLTKEVVWRGSIYAEKDIGTTSEFERKLTQLETWDEKTAKSLSDNLSKAFRTIFECQYKMIKNVNVGDIDDTVSIRLNSISYPYDDMGVHCIYMCRDGFCRVKFKSEYPPENYDELSKADKDRYDTLQYFSAMKLSGNISSHIFKNEIGTDAISEYNSFSIEILPQDNIYELS